MHKTDPKERSEGTWFFYMLRCRDDSLYSGITNNLEKRVHAHNHLNSGAKYTKKRRPCTLEYFETFPDKSAAAKREYQVKQLTRNEKLDLIYKK